MVNMGKNLITILSRKWKKEYDWLPQNNTTYLGKAELNSPNGSEGQQTVEFDIQGLKK